MAEVKIPTPEPAPQEQPKPANRGVVNGSARVEKKSLAKQFFKDAAVYARDNVIIPSAKQLLAETVNGGTNLFRDAVNGFTGKVLGVDLYSTRPANTVASGVRVRPYNDYSAQSTQRAQQRQTMQINPISVTTVSSNAAKRYIFTPIEYTGPSARQDAIDVLQQMREQIKATTTYNEDGNIIDEGFASVLDLKELSKNPNEVSSELEMTQTDDNWGWYDLSTAEVVRTDYGYTIRFPRCEPRRRS